MTDKPKLTPWYPSSVKPARPGVYNTSYVDSWHSKWTGYSYWDGRAWTSQCRDPERARVSGTYYANQNKRWRGLAEAPTA